MRSPPTSPARSPSCLSPRAHRFRRARRSPRSSAQATRGSRNSGKSPPTHLSRRQLQDLPKPSESLQPIADVQQLPLRRALAPDFFELSTLGIDSAAMGYGRYYMRFAREASYSVAKGLALPLARPEAVATGRH